jgi:hypothetical protein
MEARVQEKGREEMLVGGQAGDCIDEETAMMTGFRSL